MRAENESGSETTHRSIRPMAGEPFRPVARGGRQVASRRALRLCLSLALAVGAVVFFWFFFRTAETPLGGGLIVVVLLLSLAPLLLLRRIWRRTADLARPTRGGIPMKTKDEDQHYFCARANEELKLAQESENRAAVAVHSELARRYLDRIRANDDEPKEQ